jgi:hypothetical protein
MTFDLLNRRLTDVDNRQTFTMPPKDFLRQAAGRPWREIPLLIALWRMVPTGEVPHGVVLRQAD